MKNFLKFSVLLLFSFIIGNIYFFAYTEEGLRLVIQHSAKFLPGHLHINEVHGTLLSEFSLQDIHYQDEDQTTTIKSLQIAWEPSQLLQGKFDIKKLVLNQGKVKIKKPNTDTAFLQFIWVHLSTVQQLIINQLSIQNADAEINFNGTLGTKLTASWNIQIPHLHVFLPNCRGSVFSTGTIMGSQTKPIINAAIHAEKLIIDNNRINKLDGKTTLNLESNAYSKLQLSAKDITVKNCSLRKINMDANLHLTHNQQVLNANFDFLIEQKHKISASLSLPKYSHALDLNQPITGKIALNSTQLNFLTTSISDIKSPRGILKGDFLVSGTLSKPHITGELTLNNGHIAIPKFGISLDDINLKTENVLSELISYKGSFQSGNGKATFQGLIDLTQPEMPISLELQGEDLEVINLPEYKVTASPNMKLTLMNNQLSMEGDILIPYAEITPNTFSSTVTLTNDVVFVEENKKSSSLPFATAMKINLVLGNKIHVGYKELQTHLRGKLFITQTPTSLATATGELHAVDGTYRAYGKTLTIQEGRLIFTDSQLTNPGLNIRASKQIKTVSVSGTSSFTNKTELTPISMGTETVTAGVQIIGTFEKPVVSLFSNPSGMSQTDILSYLILGHPQSQNSGKQTSALLSAVSAFNAGGTSKLSNLTQGIQNKLGLNELNVESTEVFNPNSGSSNQTTSLVVGKQLAPNLYVHYSMGLFDPIKILNLRYQLSKRFAIQSETSNMGNGADLLYGIERD